MFLCCIHAAADAAAIRCHSKCSTTPTHRAAHGRASAGGPNIIIIAALPGKYANPVAGAHPAATPSHAFAAQRTARVLRRSLNYVVPWRVHGGGTISSA